MSKLTCEIDGKIFEGVPHNEAADSLCEGCAGDGNNDVCGQLADCLHPRIIWIEAA